jgi:phospholipid transport system transporter-binding protein
VIKRDGDVLRVEGPVTLDTVPALLEQAGEHIAGGVTRVDFGGATEVDSSAVALALEWERQARRVKGVLVVENLPDAMQNLAKLYGVLEFLLHPGTRQ